MKTRFLIKDSSILCAKFSLSFHLKSLRTHRQYIAGIRKSKRRKSESRSREEREIKFVSRGWRNSSNFLFQSRGHYSISRISRLRDIEIFLLFRYPRVFSFEISFLHPLVPPHPIRHRCAVIASREFHPRSRGRSEKKWPSPRVT